MKILQRIDTFQGKCLKCVSFSVLNIAKSIITPNLTEKKLKDFDDKS